MLDTMRCAKCGLTQLAAATCKSCRTATGRASRAPILRSIPATPSPPHATAHAAVPAVAPVDAPYGASPVTSADPAPSAADGQERRLFFHGSGGSLLGIQIVNVFLTLITLGVYHFWGKVRVRSYLFSGSEFDGDRFAYHGTGKELLIGSLKAGLVLGALFALMNASPYLPGGAPARIAAFATAYGLLLLFIPVAIVGARRYRLSRISWRNIRFSFRGRVADFLKIFAGGGFLTLVTLGLYYPVYATRQHAFLVAHSYFGDRQFAFDGRGHDLFGSYLLGLVLLLPTLGLSWLWFLARKQRYLWDHTSFESARFRCTVTGGRLARLYTGNLLLLVLTLGLALAWVRIRNVRFAFAYLTLRGSLDPAAIRQDAQPAAATGDGLESLLDLGGDFAVG
jgi:uncharacterized membrane protein YjgN (DUF898 family)